MRHARMALEEPHPQRRLQRVDAADDGRMMHAKRLRGTAHRAHARHRQRIADIVPAFDLHCAPLHRTCAFIAVSFGDAKG